MYNVFTLPSILFTKQLIIILFLKYYPVLLKVFTVRSGGAVGVVVKGPKEKDTITFR